RAGDDPLDVRDQLAALRERKVVVDLRSALVARALVLVRVAGTDQIFRSSEPVRGVLEASRPRVRRQVLALAAAEPSAEERASVGDQQRTDAPPAAPGAARPPLRHRSDARPPPIVTGERKDVAAPQLPDEVRQSRQVAVELVRREHAERIAPVALA